MCSELSLILICLLGPQYIPGYSLQSKFRSILFNYTSISSRSITLTISNNQGGPRFLLLERAIIRVYDASPCPGDGDVWTLKKQDIGREIREVGCHCLFHHRSCWLFSMYKLNHTSRCRRCERGASAESARDSNRVILRCFQGNKVLLALATQQGQVVPQGRCRNLLMRRAVCIATAANVVVSLEAPQPAPSDSSCGLDLPCGPATCS